MKVRTGLEAARRQRTHQPGIHQESTRTGTASWKAATIHRCKWKGLATVAECWSFSQRGVAVGAADDVRGYMLFGSTGD